MSDKTAKVSHCIVSKRLKAKVSNKEVVIVSEQEDFRFKPELNLKRESMLRMSNSNVKLLKVCSHETKFSPSPIFRLLLFSIVSMVTG